MPLNMWWRLFESTRIVICLLGHAINELQNIVVLPETNAEEEAVNIPILSWVNEPYPPATTLMVEESIDTMAKKNDILSKSEMKACIE